MRAALGLTGLPDCRMYEMITPPYKEGFPLYESSYSSNGEKAILFSQASLADDTGSTEYLLVNGVYLDMRTPVGWNLSPMNAPFSSFVGELPIAEEADSGYTLWEQHTPAQPASSRGLYIRSDTGSFHYVGPLSPHENLLEEASSVIEQDEDSLDLPVASTTRYGHVVLEALAAGARWPYDKTVGPEVHSVYEYSGEDNSHPILVGVTGPKASSALLATCGTELGAPASGSRFNALAGDGETIFVTVNACGEIFPATELYARIHGSLGTDEEAETVDVSADECTISCSEEISGKNFEGASENGKVVFFTSTQKLTNDATLGTAGVNATKNLGCAATYYKAGNGCNLYMYNFAAPAGARLRCISVSGGVLGVAGVSQDGSRIYYVSDHADSAAGKGPYGGEPMKGQPNLYFYDASTNDTTYITSLNAEEDESDWSRSPLRPVELAGTSGEAIIFVSTEPVTPDDHTRLPQLFEYKAASSGEPAELVRVTKGENGFNENGNGVARGIEPASIATITAESSSVDFKSTTNRSNISVDGRTVVFASIGQLSPRATSASQGCKSIYEFHTTNRLSEANVRLISDGRDTQPFKGAICGAQFMGMDATGTNVLFATADPLLPLDTDSVQRDIYDARINGGVAQPPQIGSCGLETCGEPISRSSTTAEVIGSNGRPELSTDTRLSFKRKKAHSITCRNQQHGKRKVCRQQVRRPRHKSAKGGKR